MEYNKEILSDKEYYSLIKETITEVGNSITATLGPDGRTRIIKDRDGNYYITKDGVSVLKSIAFINPAKNIITTIIKEVADKTVKQAGDGTTTSILFAQFFILKGIEFLEKGMSFNEIKKELEELEEYVLNKIKEGTKEIKGD
ncbi:MAG: TCP-1/cpn60 chaperonin family protein, partial [Senegalia sp. (in: firmicutes)]